MQSRLNEHALPAPASDVSVPVSVATVPESFGFVFFFPESTTAPVSSLPESSLPDAAGEVDDETQAIATSAGAAKAKNVTVIDLMWVECDAKCSSLLGCLYGDAHPHFQR